MYHFPNETDAEGRYVCVGARGVEEIFVPLFRFCRKLETTLKNSLCQKKVFYYIYIQGRDFL